MTFDWLKTILGDAYRGRRQGRRRRDRQTLYGEGRFRGAEHGTENIKAQLAEANKTIEGLQAADKDIEAVRKEAADYKAKAEQAGKRRCRAAGRRISSTLV